VNSLFGLILAFAAVFAPLALAGFLIERHSCRRRGRGARSMSPDA
jgi:hypothetical protein